MNLPKDNSTKTIVSDYFTLTTGTIIKNVSSFIIFALIARILSVDDYGRYSLLITLSTICGVLIGWTDPAVIRFGKEEIIIRGDITKTFWSDFVIRMANLLIIIIVIFVFRTQINQYLGIGYKSFFFLMFLVFAISFNPLLSFFQALGKIKYYSFIPLVAPFTLLIFLFMMILNILHKNLENIIEYNIMGSFIVVLLNFYRIKKHLKRRIFDFSYIKKIFQYSYGVVFWVISMFALQQINILFLKQFRSIGTVGIYSVAQRLHDYIQIIPANLSILLIPIFTTFLVREQTEKIKNYHKYIVPQLSMLWCFLLMVLIIISPVLLTLLGEKFMSALVPFRLFIFIIAVESLFFITSPIINTHDLIRKVIPYHVLFAILNLVLAFLLIKSFGITGAVISFGIPMIGLSLTRAYIVKKYIGINIYMNIIYSIPCLLLLLFTFFTNNAIFQIIVLILMIIIILLIGRTKNIFNIQTLNLLEAIKIPGILKTKTIWVYRRLLA